MMCLDYEDRKSFEDRINLLQRVAKLALSDRGLTPLGWPLDLYSKTGHCRGNDNMQTQKVDSHASKINLRVVGERSDNPHLTTP